MAARKQITRGEDFEYEFTIPSDEVPSGEDIDDWTLSVRFGQPGSAALFSDTPTQDPTNQYRYTGTIAAATTAAISDSVESITASVWRTDPGSKMALHANGIGECFPVVDSVEA